MVTRNRKFPTPHGYSRNYVKRDTRQLLTEELNEPSNRLTGLSVSGAAPRLSRVAFELEPTVPTLDPLAQGRQQHVDP